MTVDAVIAAWAAWDERPAWPETVAALADALRPWATEDRKLSRLYDEIAAGRRAGLSIDGAVRAALEPG